VVVVVAAAAAVTTTGVTHGNRASLAGSCLWNAVSFEVTAGRSGSD